MDTFLVIQKIAHTQIFYIFSTFLNVGGSIHNVETKLMLVNSLTNLDTLGLCYHHHVVIRVNYFTFVSKKSRVLHICY